MADLKLLEKEFKAYKSNLKKTSYDKQNKESLCLKEDEVIHFENYSIEYYHKNKMQDRKTVDALYYDINKWNLYLIEFKNEKPSSIKKDEVLKKFKDSVALLKEILKKNNISLKDITIYLYLVVKDKKESETFKDRQRGENIDLMIDSAINTNELPKCHHKCRPKKYFLKNYKEIFNEEC
ncbi:hypothetical protein DMB92_02250 [Campylobacter sp. MIT 99-7217]|uniref:hypothetical protein n=1 Tax=Campylobacter sp. MIT 99-7217 TaxID=535091 RepID=UPI001159AFD9|nr:hypothetical protein [Campylobacter sp. MIT 99-7217]TQR33729.1 hypothetical protein DMB92_02250 [Campylobacter sp. MIT 99-7217]